MDFQNGSKKYLVYTNMVTDMIVTCFSVLFYLIILPIIPVTLWKLFVLFHKK